jgi:hypothetical protein
MKSATRKKGVPLRSQFQEAILFIYNHFDDEKRAGHLLGDIKNPKQRVLDILGVSLHSTNLFFQIQNVC